MSDKQQKILQMAKDICRVKHICTDVCEPISACDALRYAERAVEAGYSKQSEGVWKRTTEQMGYHDVACVECSACDESWVLDDDSNDFECIVEYWHYCPNCGAKMKGGTE